MIRILSHIFHWFKLCFSYQQLRIALPPILPWNQDDDCKLSLPEEGLIIFYRLKTEIAGMRFFFALNLSETKTI
jgi:hypothetical protein